MLEARDSDRQWYGDPSGAREIMELRCAGFVIWRGDNEQGPSIGAVLARLENGALLVVEGSCPNLLVETGLYRVHSWQEIRVCRPGREQQRGSKSKTKKHTLEALRKVEYCIDPCARTVPAGRWLGPAHELWE